MRTPFEQNELDRMRKDPENYKWGVYCNSKDPRIILPKRYEWMGWTLNFGRPESYLILTLVIVLAIVIANLLG